MALPWAMLAEVGGQVLDTVGKGAKMGFDMNTTLENLKLARRQQAVSEKNAAFTRLMNLVAASRGVNAADAAQNRVSSIRNAGAMR